MAIRGDLYLKNRNLYLSSQLSQFINQSKALIEFIIKIDNKSFFNKYFMPFLFFKLKNRIFYLWRKLGKISIKLNLLVYLFFLLQLFQKKNIFGRFGREFRSRPVVGRDPGKKSGRDPHSVAIEILNRSDRKIFFFETNVIKKINKP